jgi:alkylation response protein AidB-like acyl-CoA dehydrogenase
MTIQSNALRSGWKDSPAPATHEQWLQRAAEVASILSEDVIERDHRNAAPAEQIVLLKESGLVTMLGPAAGNGGANWATANAVTRRVAQDDASLAQILGYHYLWTSMPRLWGTDEQRERFEAKSVRESLLWAAAVNPRDNDVVIHDEGDQVRIRGRKSFSTGARASDHLILEGVFVDENGHPTEQRAFALAPSNAPGISYGDDWDNIGMRLTESGSVTIEDVRVPWSDLLGYTDKQQEIPPEAALTTLIHQLLFVNLYVGIARGAVETAAAYTREHTRPWLNAVGITSASEDPYILGAYGRYGSDLMAVEALTDRAIAAMQAAHDAPEQITEQLRGELAVLVFAAKANATKVALEVTSGIFEATGARATTSSLGFDRFWRDVRTHTVHDPVAYKLREVGDYILNGRFPEPGWYS